ncbi:MAG: MFS transporter [Novosphingobium sp.]|nr:MFS transporter [Novosphingobium sp.]
MTAEANCQVAADRRFLALYALAWAGATVAYVPLLTLLLPMHVDRLAGAEAVRWLALTTFAGAIVASAANIGAGWLSDLWGRRRPFVLAGLALSTAMLLAMPHADTLAVLMGLIVVWQLGLNLMLGPLSAWAGDRVPDARRGMLGGLLAFAPASGALAGAVVTIPGVADLPLRFAIVGALVVLCVVPIVLLGEEWRQTGAPSEIHAGEMARKVLRGMATRMWLARLLVQVSEASLFAYFYLWLRTVDPALPDDAIARVLVMAMVIGALTALVAGRWADRNGRPVAPLVAASGGAAAGLVIMALAQDRDGAIGGYLLFGLSTAVFLALHSAHVLRVLPNSTRRGRDLGFFNLTNTIPSLVVPSLTLALVPTLGFGWLFAVLAIFAIAALALLLNARR